MLDPQLLDDEESPARSIAAIMNGHASSINYAEKFDTYRQSDAQRDALIADILQEFEALKAEYEVKCEDHDNEVQNRRMWQREAKSHERALAEHKQASGSNSFVYVILDGDGAPFNDLLYAQGKEGGAQAAHQLHAEIKGSLRAKYPDAAVDDWNIVVQVILNLQGLANKLVACGIVSHVNEVFAFGRQFGLAQPLFSFVDVGQGKEHADFKVRETLRVFLPNAQCKHVFFGPCLDNGYLVELEQYKRDFASRLTLIETRRSEPGFISLPFQRVSFPSVFRAEPLPTKTMGFVPPTPPSVVNSPLPVRSGSVQFQATTAPFIPKSASPAPSTSTDSSQSQSTSWATVGKNGAANGKLINIAAKKTPARRFILFNVNGQRLDDDLPRMDHKAESRFTERRRAAGKNLCNKYHLTGNCESGKYCDYLHGEKLSPGEILVLKHKARNRLCQNEVCDNFECTHGHSCKNGDSCYGDECWLRATHGMDTEPAKRVFENGTEEWIQAYLDKQRG